MPGDKSISHRALMLNAIAVGRARVTGLSPGADLASTASCLRALGVAIEGDLVEGRGLDGLRPPAGPLDCGNSGTTMRLLAGILAGRPFTTTLVGDESLSGRPMGRVAEPLRLMGARVAESPLTIKGGRLRGIDHRPPVASAQVKSAIILAGLQATGETSVTEPAATRNHTELMLIAMGADVRTNGRRVSVRPGRLASVDVTVPGDLSAAAFWLVLGGLYPGARLTVPGVGVNESRAGLLRVLEGCGIRVAARFPRRSGGEPVADLEVDGGGWQLAPLRLAGALSAAVIDEIPVLAVAAALLPGRSVIRDAAELRVKESDRIAAMAEGLQAMGARVLATADGFEIEGGLPLEGARVRSFGDHRVAMALAVAGVFAGGTTEIDDPGCVTISYPGFWEELDALGALC